MASKIKGKCKYCGKEYTRSYITRHLASCKARAERLEKEGAKRQTGYFELFISGRYDPDMWLVIEADENVKLTEIDRFLRDIWLECCGHMSAFTIDGKEYSSHPQPASWFAPPAESMVRRLKTVLREGMTIRYEYDFGSTTELEIRVTHYRKGPMRREPLTLLSRNDPTEYICSVCKKEPAVYIDTERMYDEDPFLCKKCSKKYDGEMLLKVCNSPRMGVCAYEGSDRYPDQFIPDTELSDGKT